MPSRADAVPPASATVKLAVIVLTPTDPRRVVRPLTRPCPTPTPACLPVVAVAVVPVVGAVARGMVSRGDGRARRRGGVVDAVLRLHSVLRLRTVDRWGRSRRRTRCRRRCRCRRAGVLMIRRGMRERGRGRCRHGRHGRHWRRGRHRVVRPGDRGRRDRTRRDESERRQRSGDGPSDPVLEHHDGPLFGGWHRTLTAVGTSEAWIVSSGGRSRGPTRAGAAWNPRAGRRRVGFVRGRTPRTYHLLSRSPCAEPSF